MVLVSNVSSLSHTTSEAESIWMLSNNKMEIQAANMESTLYQPP